jgi:porin
MVAGQWLLSGCPALAQSSLESAGRPAAIANQPAPGAGESDADSLWTRDRLTGDWGGFRARLESVGVKFGLQEQSELWANLTGGLRRGVVYDGLTTASLTIDLEKALRWPGATFFVNGYQIHGRGPSANLVGNQQLVSGGEATRDTKLFELWLEQALFDNRLSVRLGQGGINDELMSSTYSALFLNASFGLSGLSAADLPSGAPTYPLATPFVRVQGKPTDRLTVSMALFNGDPAPEGTGDPQLRDRGGVAFRTDAHALLVGEIAYALNNEDDATGLPGTYKLGAWYHFGHFADQRFDSSGVPLASPTSNGVPRQHTGDFAIYGIVDQMLFATTADKKKGIGVFAQVIAAPAAFNVSNLFVSAGFNWIGPFGRPETDIFGIAVAYLGLSPARRQFGNDLLFFTGQGTPYRTNETVIEVTYQLQLAPWWQIQPDLQIVLNPLAGIPPTPGGRPLSTAMVSGVRTVITF